MGFGLKRYTLTNPESDRLSTARSPGFLDIIALEGVFPKGSAPSRGGSPGVYPIYHTWMLPVPKVLIR